VTPEERAQIRQEVGAWHDSGALPVEAATRIFALLDELERLEGQAGVFMSERDHAESQRDALRAALAMYDDAYCDIISGQDVWRGIPDDADAFKATIEAAKQMLPILRASVSLPEGKPQPGPEGYLDTHEAWLRRRLADDSEGKTNG